VLGCPALASVMAIGAIASNGRVELTTCIGIAAVTVSPPLSVTSMTALPGVPAAAPAGAETASVSPSSVASKGEPTPWSATLIPALSGSSGSEIIGARSTLAAASPATTLTWEG